MLAEDSNWAPMKKVGGAGSVESILDARFKINRIGNTDRLRGGPGASVLRYV